MKNRFDSRLNNVPGAVWNKITQIDELKGRWSAGTKLNPHLLGRLKRSVLVTSTGASTRIEGVKLSDEEIEKFLKGISIQKLIDRDEQEVKGYYELLENVFNSWQHIKFSEGAIKHFHKELLKYTEKDKFHLGEYKKQENKVHAVDGNGRILGVVFDTTPAYKTPIEMQELAEWTVEALKNKTHHPLLIIANFIVEFLAIHPFQDGNGRISRVLTNLLLLQAGYSYIPYVSHEKLIEDNKQGYYLALRSSQKTFKSKNESITAWLGYFADILLKQTGLAIELVGQENIESILSEKQSSVWKLFQEEKVLVPGKIASKLRFARPTVNQILTKLMKLEKIERIGLGRAVRYKLK
jgi:Fic family protein